MSNLLNLFRGKGMLCTVKTPLSTYSDVPFDSIIHGVDYINFECCGCFITVESIDVEILLGVSCER